MSKYHFKEGESVYHKDNLLQKMTVSRILKESITFNKGFDKATNEPIKKVGIRMIGVECHWWSFDAKSGQKNLEKYKFHSNELVPEDVKDKGEDHVKTWISSQVK